MLSGFVLLALATISITAAGFGDAAVRNLLRCWALTVAFAFAVAEPLAIVIAASLPGGWRSCL
jgi:hypothetical protein